MRNFSYLNYIGTMAIIAILKKLNKEYFLYTCSHFLEDTLINSTKY